MSYPKATPAYRRALSELHLRADYGVPSIHCPATGKLVWPAQDHPDASRFLDNEQEYLTNIPTVLFVYEHHSGNFVFLRQDVGEQIRRARVAVGGVFEKSDFDVLVEHTPDFGGGFLVIDLEETAPGGHHDCITIGFDLARR